MKQIPPAAAWYFTIIGVRFFRAPRGKTEHKHKYGYSLLGDVHLAEDVAQEAFASAYRDLPQLREPAAFPGWFRTIVFKQCHRLTRRRQLATVPLDAAAELPAQGNNPAETVERRASLTEVGSAASGCDISGVQMLTKRQNKPALFTGHQLSHCIVPLRLMWQAPLDPSQRGCRITTSGSQISSH